MLNGKKVHLLEDSNTLHSGLCHIDQNYISTLHSSPSRIHVIKNPLYSSHIYENINIYTSALGASCLGPLEYLSLKRSKNRNRNSKQSSSKSPQKIHQLQGCAKEMNSDIQKSPYKRALCNSIPSIDSAATTYSPVKSTNRNAPHVNSRNIENRLLRSLKVNTCANKLYFLYHFS